MVKFTEALEAIYEDNTKVFSRSEGSVKMCWEGHMVFKDRGNIKTPFQTINREDMELDWKLDWKEVGKYCEHCGQEIDN